MSARKQISVLACPASTTANQPNHTASQPARWRASEPTAGRWAGRGWCSRFEGQRRGVVMQAAMPQALIGSYKDFCNLRLFLFLPTVPLSHRARTKARGGKKKKRKERKRKRKRKKEKGTRKRKALRCSILVQQAANRRARYWARFNAFSRHHQLMGNERQKQRKTREKNNPSSRLQQWWRFPICCTLLDFGKLRQRCGTPPTVARHWAVALEAACCALCLCLEQPPPPAKRLGRGTSRSNRIVAQTGR